MHLKFKSSIFQSFSFLYKIPSLFHYPSTAAQQRKQKHAICTEKKNSGWYPLDLINSDSWKFILATFSFTGTLSISCPGDLWPHCYGCLYCWWSSELILPKTQRVSHGCNTLRTTCYSFIQCQQPQLKHAMPFLMMDVIIRPQACLWPNNHGK